MHGQLRRHRHSQDHVEEPIGRPGLRIDFGKGKRGKRRVLRRFEHHRVAHGERRRGLPPGALDRIVPGADTDADAERLAFGVSKGPAEIDVFAVECGDRAAKEFQCFSRRCGIGDQRFLDRFAGVQGFEAGEFRIAFAQMSAPALRVYPAKVSAVPRPAAPRSGLDRQLRRCSGTECSAAIVSPVAG
jgi:hypothetical protein